MHVLILASLGAASSKILLIQEEHHQENICFGGHSMFALPLGILGL